MGALPCRRGTGDVFPGSPGAVLILEVQSQDAARAVLADLPLVTGGVIDFEVIELHPFSALSVLFGSPIR